ncbi:MAG: hypothetical protein U0822_09990 [Anaerolineae bacterium]
MGNKGTTVMVLTGLASVIAVVAFLWAPWAESRTARVVQGAIPGALQPWVAPILDQKTTGWSLGVWPVPVLAVAVLVLVAVGLSGEMRKGLALVQAVLGGVALGVMFIQRGYIENLGTTLPRLVVQGELRWGFWLTTAAFATIVLAAFLQLVSMKDEWTTHVTG